jgi:hypothetical protein
MKVLLSLIFYVRSAWPRLGLYEERCAIFEAIYREGGELPALEVVAMPDGRYLLVDGMHRLCGAKRAGLESIDVVLVQLVGIETPEDVAFRRALETATTSSLPLNRAERQMAAVKLIAKRPDLSRREVARLVGVAHSTVDRWVQLAEQEREHAEDNENNASYSPSYGPSADDVARRFVSHLARLSDNRGLFDYLMPKRMGRHLAGAFVDRYGDGALSEVRQVKAWVDRACEVIAGGSA